MELFVILAFGFTAIITIAVFMLIPIVIVYDIVSDIKLNKAIKTMKPKPLYCLLY